MEAALPRLNAPAIPNGPAMPEGWVAPDPVGDLMSGLDQGGVLVDPVDPNQGEPYVDQPGAVVQPTQPKQPAPQQPTKPSGPPLGYRDPPNQQPEGRPQPERKGDALFF